MSEEHPEQDPQPDTNSSKTEPKSEEPNPGEEQADNKENPSHPLETSNQPVDGSANNESDKPSGTDVENISKDTATTTTTTTGNTETKTDSAPGNTDAQKDAATPNTDTEKENKRSSRSSSGEKSKKGMALEGYLRKKGAVRHNWKKRFVVLSNKGLVNYYSVTKSSKGETRVNKGSWKMQDITQIHTDTHKMVIYLHSSLRIWQVQEPDVGKFSKWLEAFKSWVES